MQTATDASQPVPNQDTAPPLLKQSITALKWNYLGVAIRVLLQLVAQITIARLIGPGEFGTATAAVFVIGIAGIFVELGLGSGLVQKKDLAPTDVVYAWKTISSAAVLAAAVLYILAGPIALLWNDEHLASPLRAILLALVAQASGIVSLSLLKRNLDFKTIQVAQLSGYFLGFFVTGISLAAMGSGAWSLVCAWIVQSVVTSGMLYYRARHPLRVDGITSNRTAPLKKYGQTILLTNVCNWVIENVDNFLVGRFFGARALGAYAVSYNLVRTPTNHLVTSIQQVLFPASSQARQDTHALRTTYVVVLWGISLIVFPTFFGVATLAETIVLALYGSAWLDASTLLVPLALAMPSHALMAIGGPILWGRGQAGRELKVQSIIVLLLVIALLIAANYSVAWMAWAVLVVYSIRALWIQYQVVVALQARIILILLACLPGFLLGILVSATIYQTNSLLLMQSLSSIQRLFAAGAAGAAIMMMAAVVGRAWLPTELRSALQEAPGLPKSLRKLLGLK